MMVDKILMVDKMLKKAFKIPDFEDESFALDVDKELSQLENYRLSEYELNNLEDTLACYMSVFLEDDHFQLWNTASPLL